MKVLKNLAVVLNVITLTACNNVSIEGDWIEPVPGMENMIQGISLKTDGKASSINMATLQYEKWEQKDNLLILSGTSIGNHQTLSFTDTLKIEKLTEDSLILRKGELILKYSKANEEQTTDLKQVSAITPSNSILSVKGELIIGHEVRSFTAENDSMTYWIVDETGELTQKYDDVTKGVKNGTPVYVELEVVDMGKSDEGFAADYDGVYQVMKINKITAK